MFGFGVAKMDQQDEDAPPGPLDSVCLTTKQCQLDMSSQTMMANATTDDVETMEAKGDEEEDSTDESGLTVFLTWLNGNRKPKELEPHSCSDCNRSLASTELNDVTLEKVANFPSENVEVVELPQLDSEKTVTVHHYKDKWAGLAKLTGWSKKTSQIPPEMKPVTSDSENASFSDCTATDFLNHHMKFYFSSPLDPADHHKLSSASAHTAARKITAQTFDMRPHSKSKLKVNLPSQDMSL